MQEQRNNESSDTSTPQQEVKRPPQFKNRQEADAYALKESGVTMKEVTIINQFKPSERHAVHMFYLYVRREKISMNAQQEIQFRKAFVNGFFIGQSSAEAKNGK